jgi:hypothetical protein
MLRPIANLESAALPDPSLTSIVDPDKIIWLALRAIPLGKAEPHKKQNHN